MGRSSWGGNGNSLQYSCLGNPMDRGASWATVHGVTKSQTRSSTHRESHTHGWLTSAPHTMQKQMHYVVCDTDLRSYMSCKELGPEEGIRSSIPSCSFSCDGGLRTKKARGCAGKGETRARLEPHSSTFPGTRGLILEVGGHGALRTTVATDHHHCLRKMPFSSV